MIISVSIKYEPKNESFEFRYKDKLHFSNRRGWNYEIFMMIMGKNFLENRNIARGVWEHPLCPVASYPVGLAHVYLSSFY